MHFEKVTPLSAFLLGNAFSLGWTPCIGPVLSSVLFMAGSTQNYLAGFWLLLVFSMGLAMPGWLKKHARHVSFRAYLHQH